MDATLALPAPLASRTLPALARAALWTVLAALSALVVANTLPYFADAEAMPFFEEKGALAASPVWRTAFFLHVAGGILCLAAALPLFSRRLLRARPGVHRALGWAYVASALVLVAPTGLVMTPTAKGGLAGASGFAATGLSLLVTTAAGLRHVLRRDFVAHRAWMIRSYAMASTALSFRVVFVAMSALAVPRAYEIGVWLAFGVGALAAEAAVGRAASRSLDPVPRRIP